MQNILLPDHSLFGFKSHNFDGKKLTLEISTVSQEAICPDCHQPSSRIHSHYLRTVRDLPVSGHTVVLLVSVRRLFCDTKSCSRCTFTERMTGTIEAYARRTNRLIDSQRIVGFIAGGESGAKITRKLALSSSPDTIIRMVRNTRLVESPTPRVLGLDDWALRKGHSYGTILVDLETHRPIDLLPDRSAETVKKWLLEHPGVEIVSRDRSSVYIEGINAGAPQAIQVTDRWHLLHNLVEAIERVLNRRYSLLQQAFRQSCIETVKSEDKLPANQPSDQEKPSPEKPITYTKQQRIHIREKHRAQFEEIRRLRNVEGLSIRAICRQLCVGKEKVHKNLANSEPPEYKRRKQKTILTPYWAYLVQRWTSGERNGMVLWKEIQNMGFSGSYQSMARELVSLKKKMPKERKQASAQKQASRKTENISQIRPFSARQTTWLFVKKQTELEGEKARYFSQLLSSSEEFQQLHVLVQQFWAMVCERKKDEFQPWIIQAKTVGIIELKNFAQGLEKDSQAVEAALTYEWSNGPTEGHNNRLKMIKRQMYGRAKFDLLRKRVLYSGI